ncbi:MAG: hypothetical protein P0Y59_13245 [Candidatus Sphingomonas phytovorans]|nr:hypothetical protein [Sphingomonas sp.]WEJ97931.1 MAG: hypothetical protein P0Y59_13245 [Sphingomonas sp.]
MGDGISRKRHYPGERFRGPTRHKGSIVAAIIAMCLGLATATVAAPSDARETVDDTPMTFVLADSPADRQRQDLLEGGDRTIYAAGDITSGTTKQFLAFVKARNITQARVYFDSPGGLSLEGMELGRAIRALHFNTAVGARRKPGAEPSICASACAYAYAGGESRFLDEDGGSLGLHQFHLDKKKAPTSDVQAMSALMLSYLTEMGVDSEAFTLASMTAPDDLLILSSEDAERLGFANNGALPTTAGIELPQMTPLLMITQVHYDRKVRLGFACSVSRLHMEAEIESARDGEPHVKGLTRAYFEFDDQPALIGRGPGAASFAEGAVHLSRVLDEENQMRLVKTRKVKVWLENGAPDRWGGSIDLRQVGPQIAGFFEQCSSGRRIVPSLPATSKTQKLAIMDMRRDKDNPALALLDFGSMRRTGKSAASVSYAVGIKDKEPYYMVSSNSFDCAGLRVKALRYLSSRDGAALDSRETDWQPALPDTPNGLMLQLACGTAALPADRIRLSDAFTVMREFLDKKIYAQP